MNPCQPTVPASAPNPADLAADAFWPIPPGQDSASQTPGLLSLRGALAAKTGCGTVRNLTQSSTKGGLGVPRPQRLLVGLTGGIASGKSTVGRWLRDLGCSVADSDQLVAELYRPGEAGAEAVRRLFGPDMLDEDGAVDRATLAAVVFGDLGQRRKLEAEIHPLVGQAFRTWAEANDGIVVYEVPLLVETGGRGRFDVIVTVEADPERRIERAIERGVDEESARARLAAQASSASRIDSADYVLHNDGSLADLRAQVERIVVDLKLRLQSQG